MAARALTTEQIGVTNDEDITIERRVRVPATDSATRSSCKTARMGKIDSRLLAIARGELEPYEDVFDLLIVDDPFGGLIPIYDDAEDVQDDWLDEVDETASIALDAVPRIAIRTAQILALPLDHRSGFTLSHVDGRRTVEEILDVSHLGPDDTLQVLAALLRMGAIAID